MKTFKITHKTDSQTFSIIIPFRNEAKNILALVNSLSALNYSNSNFEIIFVNDCSTDDSVSLFKPFLLLNKHWKLLNNQRKSNAPKKDAINTAINIAKYKWIITTDADCEVPKNWLQCFNDFILLHRENTNTINMIVAPVGYKTDNSFLQNFQNMDFLSLIGSTIGAFGIGKPFLCNGANLCYKKEVFLKLNGFKGNDNIASGDDVFLMDKILTNYPNSVHYLKSKDAMVTTKPEETVKGLFAQRIRWASKTSATKNWFGKLVGFLVFLMNLIVVLGFVFLIFSAFNLFQNDFNRYLEVFILVFLLKFNIDFILIQKTYKFIGIQNKLKAYIFSGVLYPFFVVCIVFLSFFKKYEWKGRRFNK